MLSMRFTKYVGLVILTVAIFFSLSSISKAQEESSLQISPAIVDISGKLGSSVVATILISNISDEPMAVSADVRSLTPEDEAIDPESVSKYDATKWIRIPVKDYLIEARKSVSVDIEVTIPDDAVPGGHYALSVFRVLNPTKPDGSGVTVTPEAGAVMLITVPGNITESAEVHTIESSSFLLGGSAKVVYDVMNTGNTHITPIIKTIIKDRAGKTVETITQPVQLLLPNTKRKVEILWGSGKLGKYSVDTTISYGTPTQMLNAQSTTFSKVPPVWEIVAKGGVVLIAMKYISSKKTHWLSALKTSINNKTQK